MIEIQAIHRDRRHTGINKLNIILSKSSAAFRRDTNKTLAYMISTA